MGSNKGAMLQNRKWVLEAKDGCATVSSRFWGVLYPWATGVIPELANCSAGITRASFSGYWRTDAGHCNSCVSGRERVGTADGTSWLLGYLPRIPFWPGIGVTRRHLPSGWPLEKGDFHNKPQSP